MSSAARAERGRKKFTSLKAVLRTGWNKKGGFETLPYDADFPKQEVSATLWANTQVRPYDTLGSFYSAK